MPNPGLKQLIWNGLSLALVTVTISSCNFIATTADSLINRVSLEPPYNVDVSTKSQQFHETLFIADLHADTLLWERDLLERHERGHVDIPRLIEGNIALQAFTVFTKIPLPYFRLFSTPWLQLYFSQYSPDISTLLAIAQLGDARKRGSLMERASYYAEKLQEWADKSNGKFTVIKSKQNLQDYLARRTTNSQMTAGFLGLEGAHALDGDVTNVQHLFAKGYRMMALVHFFDNEFGGSSTGSKKGGLTDPKGRELIKLLGQHNIILDLSHTSVKTLDDVMQLYEQPQGDPLPAIVVSHIGIRGTCEREGRNLHAQHIEQIAKHGGLIGVGLWAGAVCGTTVEQTVDAIERVVKVVGGVQNVALGSDFDGAVRTHFEVSGMALLTQALKFRGFTDQEIRQIMGENLRDFLLDHLPA